MQSEENHLFYNQVLLYGSKIEDVDAVKNALKHQADINYSFHDIRDMGILSYFEQDDEGKTAIEIAAENNNLELIKLLIENGAQVYNEYKIHNPINAAIWKQDKDLINDLIKRGSPVVMAWPYNDESEIKNTIQFLLDSGVDINQIYTNDPDSFYETRQKVYPVLNYAILKTDEGLIIPTFLLENEADVNITDLNGRTPLMMAVRTSIPSMVGLLLEYGPDVHAMDNQEQSAFDVIDDMWSMIQDEDEKEEFKDIINMVLDETDEKTAGSRCDLAAVRLLGSNPPEYCLNE